MSLDNMIGKDNIHKVKIKKKYLLFGQRTIQLMETPMCLVHKVTQALILLPLHLHQQHEQALDTQHAVHASGQAGQQVNAGLQTRGTDLEEPV